MWAAKPLDSTRKREVEEPKKHSKTWTIGNIICMWVFQCVCVRKRERKPEQRGVLTHLLHTSSIFVASKTVRLLCFCFIVKCTLWWTWCVSMCKVSVTFQAALGSYRESCKGGRPVLYVYVSKINYFFTFYGDWSFTDDTTFLHGTNVAYFTANLYVCESSFLVAELIVCTHFKTYPLLLCCPLVTMSVWEVVR